MTHNAARPATWLTAAIVSSLAYTSCAPSSAVRAVPAPVPTPDSSVMAHTPTPASPEVAPSAAVAETTEPSEGARDSSAPPVTSDSSTRPPLPSIADSPGEIVLYDPETTSEKSGVPPHGLPANSNVVWSDKLTEEERKRVVDTLFPDKHLDEEPCPEQAQFMSLQDRRASGYFHPDVGQAVSGAFTAPAMDEKLYLVLVGECEARHYPDLWGSTVLAVFRGAALVSRVALSDAMTRILFTSDLDGDGRDEILLASDEGRQGSYHESAAVVRIDASHLTVVKKWTTVVDAECQEGPGREKSSVVYVTRGRHVRFRVETRERPCHGHGY